MSKAHLETIEKLIVEKGERKGGYYCASFTCKEILEVMGKPNTPGEQRYLAHTVKAFYPKSSQEIGSGDSGWILNIKIRSK